MVVAAELVGVPAAMVPASVAALRAVPRLGPARAALHARPPDESMAYLLDPPGLDPDIAEIWQDVRDARGRRRCRTGRRTCTAIPDAGALTPDRRTEIRQALGVLDAVSLGEPGVLEARQRIALRMRAARAHDPAGRSPRASDRQRAVARAVAARRCRRLGGRGRIAGPAGLRLRRGLAALRLAARGGVRYAGSAPAAVRGRGRAPAAAAQRPGPADRRGRRRHARAR